MAKRIIIQIDLEGEASGTYIKKDKVGKQVKLDRGDYCTTETTDVSGMIENILIFRTGKIDSVRVT